MNVQLTLLLVFLLIYLVNVFIVALYYLFTFVLILVIIFPLEVLLLDHLLQLLHLVAIQIYAHLLGHCDQIRRNLIL